MSNVYFTKDGINQSLVVASNSTNSSIGYGGSITTPVTINSTAGVQFCNANGVNVGVSISSAGISCNGLNVTGPISCSSLIIPTSSGSINSLGAITITTPILTCNGLTSTGTSTGTITGINTLITPVLTCTGAITGVTAITGTTTQTCAISGVTSLTLTGGVTMNGSISNVTILSCSTIIGVNTLTTETLNLKGASLICNNGISFTGTTGINNNGIITGINILTASGNVVCNDLRYNTLQINGTSGNVTGISSLTASGLLTLSGATASTGNIFVGSTFKCAYNGAITGVSTLSTGTLTITGASSIYIGSTYKLPYNSNNDISCNSLTTTTGAFSCTNPITITSTGVISKVTSLNMSGNLTCLDLSCNNFNVSAAGGINSTKLAATNCTAGLITISGVTGGLTTSTSTSVSNTITALATLTSNTTIFSGNLKINSSTLFDNSGIFKGAVMTLNNAVASTIASANIAGSTNIIKMIKIGNIATTPQNGTIDFSTTDLNSSTNVIVCCSVRDCPNDSAIANIMIYPKSGTIQLGNNTTQFLTGFSYRKYNMNPYMSTTLNGATSGGDIVTSYVYIAIGW